MKIHTSSNNSKYNLNAIIRVSILSAVAFVLMLIEFPLPLLPPWLKLDLGDIPALIGTFAIGPFGGAVIELLKVLLYFFIKGSGTGGVGELANFLIGVSLVVPAGLIYKKYHSHKGAFYGMMAGVLSFTIVGAVANYFILIPFYLTIMPNLYEITKGVTPWIYDKVTYVLYGASPFNLVKGLVISVVTYFIYKPLSPLIKPIALRKNLK